MVGSFFVLFPDSNRWAICWAQGSFYNIHDVEIAFATALQ